MMRSDRTWNFAAQPSPLSPAGEAFQLRRLRGQLDCEWHDTPATRQAVKRREGPRPGTAWPRPYEVPSGDDSAAAAPVFLASGSDLFLAVLARSLQEFLQIFEAIF